MFISFFLNILLKTATACCQTERQIRPDTWGYPHTTRVARQYLHANSLQMIEDEQWSPNSLQILIPLTYRVCLAMQEHFWKLHPKSTTVSELKVALEWEWDSFSQVQLTKLPRKEVARIREGWWWTFAIIQNIVHTYGVCAVNLVESFW